MWTVFIVPYSFFDNIYIFVYDKEFYAIKKIQ